MSEIIVGRLWLGGAIEVAYDEAQLRALGITHILNCALELQALEYPINAVVHKLALRDNIVDEYTGRLFHEGAAVIQTWLALPYARILVHCMGGVSRSVSTLLAYRHCVLGEAVSDALSQVQTARPCAKPYAPFLDVVVSLPRL